MITSAGAQALAERWIAAWNAHDLAAILALYSEEFAMSSPYVVEVSGEASGELHGKVTVGAYWRRALDKYPDLRLELLHVFIGVSSVVLTYRSIGGRLAAELLQIDRDGLIAAACACYSE